MLLVFGGMWRLRWKLLSLNHDFCGCTENRFVLSSLALNPISVSIEDTHWQKIIIKQWLCDLHIVLICLFSL